MITGKTSAKKTNEQSGSTKEIQRLDSLLRSYGDLVVKISNLEKERAPIAKEIHEISERNNLAEKLGDVEIHNPFKKTILVVNVGGRPYQLETHIVAKCVDDVGLEQYFTNAKINPKIIHKQVVTLTYVSEQAKNRDMRKRELINDLVKKGIVELVTERRIIPLGRKREVNIKK
jgi:hypothetical protein